MLFTKKIFRKVFVITIVMMFVFNTAVFATDLSGVNPTDAAKGFYSIGHEDPEWKAFKTSDEMRAAIYLPEELFTDLSTEEVLRATMEYPLIGDITAYNTNKNGVEYVSEHCTALRVLLTRSDARDAVKAALAEGMDYVLKIEEHKSWPNYMIYILECIMEYLEAEVNSGNAGITPQSSMVVYTPNGSAVAVFTRTEMSSDKIAEANSYYRNEYPEAQFVASSTLKYNCHSYAWYKNSTLNTYWMNDPSKYMSDGSYKRQNTVSTASRAQYPDYDHSARIYDATGNSLSNALVISKWGGGPLMIHEPRYGPYKGTITLWG